MANASTKRATLADLAREHGKAELIGGRIVPLMASGLKLNQIAGQIYRSLDDHAKRTGIGVAVTDNMAFAVPQLPSGRESFSPDAAYHVGPLLSDKMRFIDGAPIFAVEVRSGGDYGVSAERELAAKRADYFAARTLVVWDVDSKAECIHVYRSATPAPAETSKRGEIANAEPAVPGWRLDTSTIY
jgi:Uma2 family endonuclease